LLQRSYDQFRDKGTVGLIVAFSRNELIKAKETPSAC
jgi:hypothetical protein